MRGCWGKAIRGYLRTQLLVETSHDYDIHRIIGAPEASAPVLASDYFA